VGKAQAKGSPSFRAMIGFVFVRGLITQSGARQGGEHAVPRAFYLVTIMSVELATD
jgi:hypothetical protein